MKFQFQKRKARKGFALVVSITLMSILLLLIVALASLTALETQSALHTRQGIEAQQNALTALHIALGELQKYAGPDQRVTARADLQEGAKSPNAYWTGVYGNSIAADYGHTPEKIATDLTNPQKVDTTGTGSPAKLLSWLVSGNETIPFDPTVDVGASGEIVTPPEDSDIAYKPSARVNHLNKSISATDVDITIQSSNGSSQPARLMVGPGSTGDATINEVVLQDYVVAPLVELEGNGGISKGRYAWWIGDEGIKARSNLPLVTEESDKPNAFINASRTAVELMATAPSSEASLDGPRLDLAYDPLATDLVRAEKRKDLILASPSLETFSEQLKYRFHDLTPHSQSVLSDAYVGGLKRDLSILLDESYNGKLDSADPTANDNRMWIPHSGDVSGFTPGYAIPTWKHLRSFFQTRVPTTGPDAFSMTPILPAHDKQDYDGETFTDHVGVAPVLTYFSLGFTVAPNSPPAAGVEIHMNLYPLVVIWNPYNFTLMPPESDGYYEVGIFPTFATRLSLDVEENGGTTQPTWRTITTFDFQRDTNLNNLQQEYIRFRLKCPDEGIPPGQSLIFSLPDDSDALYDQKNVLLNKDPLEGYVSVPFTPINSLVPITIQSGEENARYRLRNYIKTVVKDNGDIKTENLGRSFGDGGNGLLYIYLGQPVEENVSLPVSDENIGHNPSWNSRRWYNAQQEMGWDENKVVFDGEYSYQQEPGQLVYKPFGDPSYAFLAQALFSGHGQNAQLDEDQFMFTTRWVAQGNMRAVRVARTRRDSNYNVLFTATTGNPTVKTPWQKYNSSGNRASAGNGHDWIDGRPVDAILFEFPYENQPLTSIGHLQHANLSFVGAYPSYPIGNSLADFRLHGNHSTPDGYQIARVDVSPGDNKNLTKLGRNQVGYYDISFLLNRMLWDQYYFSTIPATGHLPDILPNNRHTTYNDTVDLQNLDLSASGIMLSGGFNINSTSEQAWRAILGATNQLEYNPENPSSKKVIGPSFSRFTHPTANETTGQTVNESSHLAWNGYRILSEEEIAQLARNIVIEIRNRGPFVSLADFVNRRLVDNPTNNDTDNKSGEAFEHENFRGTIQAAIDRTAISSSDAFPVNNGSGLFWSVDEMATRGDPTLYTHNQGNQYTQGVYDQAMLEGADSAARPYSNRSAFAPKYLTQADVLATIGSSLTARSDTFIIRAYGEVVNPLNSDEIQAQAWCEAVVQRYPEYVNDANEPQEDRLDAGIKMNPDNEVFGRKFKIIDFRWLSTDEV